MTVSHSSSPRSPFRRFCDRVLDVLSTSNGHHELPRSRSSTPSSHASSRRQTPPIFTPTIYPHGHPGAVFSSYTSLPQSHRSGSPANSLYVISSPGKPRFAPRVQAPDPALYKPFFTAADLEQRAAIVGPAVQRYPPTLRIPGPNLAPSHRSVDYRLADDLANDGRGSLLYNCATGSCARRVSPSTPRLRAHDASALRASATHPPTRALRIVSRSFPWRIEVITTHAEFVTVADVLRRIHEEAARPVNEPEFNIVSPGKRDRMRMRFAKRTTVHGEAIKRCDLLADMSYLGSIGSDERFVREFHNIAQPRPGDMPTFVVEFVDYEEAMRRIGIEVRV
ncbi:hypothetical protein EXIGLDRAFT_724960 [Exidia glandulosa HHB12029]|uniref:DUF6699 domain-containing protein n=1 Tax=Exidia glandulosa HHB12029 TaxID=1314781 RepID=A0A165MMD3_EXIGL|nr:hypothetical protein EXIGLDRAFT_724960 [Exidia glandulosa HHB12029]